MLWADIKLIREVAQDKETMVLGMTASFGEIDSGTAMVCLNSDEIFKEPEPQKMWETVIHELVYAYLDITCGNFEPHPVGSHKVIVTAEFMDLCSAALIFSASKFTWEGR